MKRAWALSAAWGDAPTQRARVLAGRPRARHRRLTRPTAHVRIPPDNAGGRWHDGPVLEDFDRCYRAVQSRDARFDGWFFTAVTSTRIYCRPSCPAMTPKAEPRPLLPERSGGPAGRLPGLHALPPRRGPGLAGLERPGRRGRPGPCASSPTGRSTATGWPGWRGRLGYSERQLHRLLVAEVGTGAAGPGPGPAGPDGPPAGRDHRPGDGRRSPSPPASPACGSSTTPSARSSPAPPRELRRHRRHAAAGRDPGAVAPAPGPPPARSPRRRCSGSWPPGPSPGVEAVVDGTYHRSLRLPHGEGVVGARPRPATTSGPRSASPDLRDLTAAVSRCRRLLDLDADPVAVDAVLGRDPLLGPAGAGGAGAPGARHGRRVRAGRAGGDRPAGLGRRRPHGGRTAGGGGRPAWLDPRRGG